MSEAQRGICTTPAHAEAMCVDPVEERVLLKAALARLDNQTLEKFAPVAELFGENFLGPRQFETTFGFMPQNIHDIPFSQERLEQAKQAGMMLVLHVNENNEGSPLSMKVMNEQLSNGDKKLLWNTNWYQGEDFYTATPRLGWRLVAKEPLPESTYKNIVEQLELIVTWLKETVFANIEPPENYAQAIAEFKQKRSGITNLINTGNQWPEVSRKIASLQLAQLTLPTPSELTQTIVLHHQVSGDYLLSETYARTATPDSNGSLVSVGWVVARGARVRSNHPGSPHSLLGVLPSLQS